MNLVVKNLGDVIVAELSGTVSRTDAGRLLDDLVGTTRIGTGHLIVDVSRLEHFARSAVRGLVVTAKLLRTAGRDMRVCGANPIIKSLLVFLGFSHLLKCDPNIETSLAVLFSGQVSDNTHEDGVIPVRAESRS